MIDFYVNNLEALREIPAALPEQHVSLDNFVAEAGGALRYCPLRLVAQMPHFHAFGVAPVRAGEMGPEMRGPDGRQACRSS